MNRIAIAASTLAVAALCTGGPALARDQIQIAGSSTVLPYAQIVAEDFGKTYSKFKSPVVESGGSSAGLKQFCQGVGESTIDIANSSRPIKDNEVRACAEAGVKNIMPVRFGYDGIVFATDAKSDAWALEPKDVYLALAEEIPVDGKMVKNPNKIWKDVNDKLPDWKIAAYIPGEKHGTREVFEEKVLAIGCEAAGGMKLLVDGGMDEKAAGKACVKVRKDGGTVDIDGDYTETLARIQSNPQGVGVFGLSFYENNTDKLNVATMNGITPSVETISTGEYPVSRPLFFYVKKDHVGVIPGLKEYVEFFTSEKMIGPDGPLADYGLVPLPEDQLEALQEEVKEGKVLSM
ncbi:substrate-binding domain-containing protein [Methyloceanibacter sp.]|uniref:PstS family phosphate ABC transporter substrate-binding protein n=1 Tax=Methyloceanibacter sp. TaxID=1965321 RepID=UPI002C50CBEB|nr:substrate-binding domain-containing protein [Methyloceanibacter sp.]HML91171.1 substrate-binding domain-containing protein [Methyloceanibacter sp.]